MPTSTTFHSTSTLERESVLRLVNLKQPLLGFYPNMYRHDYVTVTQDKSPWLCSERHDKYFFGRAKTGGREQVTTKKKNHGKKMGITRPRPYGGVKKTTEKNWVLLDPVLTAG